MKKQKAKVAPSGAWGRRVDDLIAAAGWSHQQTAHRFGTSAHTVRRVRYGGRPKLKFIRRLRHLEQDHALELEAQKQGLIVSRGRLRYCWVEVPAPARTADRFVG
jgi:hypothetical protein